jgi:hypothetical protein
VSLGQDFSADAMDAFSGELYAATLTQQAVSVYDVNDPTAAPTSGLVPYPCEGIAFAYQQSDIDGTRIIRGDYRVVLLRGSLSVVPAVGDSVSIPPPGSSIAQNGRVVFVEGVTEAQVTLQVRA